MTLTPFWIMPQMQKEGHNKRRGKGRNAGDRTSGPQPSKPETRELSADQTADLVKDAKAFKKRHDKTFRLLAGRE